MRKLTWILTAVMLISLSVSSAEGQWKKMVKKDLSGWEQLNGTAPFRVEKGVVIGTTVTGSPNSFMCTKEKYGDFILEFDTWFDPKMNSGVQIRSESKADYQNGRVHGYQIEMDPSARAWSGGIYDEARRGWLYTLDKNPAGQKALKVGEWNHYRVEAIGNSIRTWINGVPCADLVDDLTPSGFIALQVHSIGNDKAREGLEVKWKNIRIITKNLEKYRSPYSPVIPQVSFLDNKLTDREINEGWKLLFDGKSPNGWMNARTKAFPVGGWEVREGMLVIDPASKKEKGGGGDIVTVDKFRNYELIIDFRYTKGANSGIKYFIDTESNDGRLASIGCEYQVLDDRNHPDAKAGKDGNRTLAGLYDLITPKNKRDNGIDKWNRATIIVNGNKVQHWLNGQMTVEYERGTQAWRDLVAGSKFKNYQGFGEVQEGRILLQDHGNLVYFKNIKIREIK
ncbi:MAG: DUF1080 domain-containing protein [Bacteroidales bacterium]|nr:DUF1080 domain-containing protein [Bacteroidales bacterium]